MTLRTAASIAMLIVLYLLRLSVAQAGVANPCTEDPSGDTFAHAVQYLQTGYNPTKYGRPPVDTSNSLSDQMIADLQKAFQIAPLRFQQMLCNLNGVYIDPGNGSWGFRDPNTFEEYIGLSGPVLWSNGSSAPAIPLAKYETDRIRYIFNLPPLGSGFGPYYGSYPVYPPEMTVLAGLAHEVGHVFWFDALKTPGGGYHYKFCKDHFHSSWLTRTPPDPWINLGDLDPAKSEHKVDQNSDNVSVQRIKTAIQNHDETEIYTILQLIYAKKGRWASALAAFSPTEDLVETFQYIVLRGSQPGFPSFPLGFIDSNQNLHYIGDIPNDHNSKQNFKPKKDCFQGF